MPLSYGRAMAFLTIEDDLELVVEGVGAHELPRLLGQLGWKLEHKLPR